MKNFFNTLVLVGTVTLIAACGNGLNGSWISASCMNGEQYFLNFTNDTQVTSGMMSCSGSSYNPYQNGQYQGQYQGQYNGQYQNGQYNPWGTGTGSNSVMGTYTVTNGNQINFTNTVFGSGLYTYNVSGNQLTLTQGYSQYGQNGQYQQQNPYNQNPYNQNPYNQYPYQTGYGNNGTLVFVRQSR